jgi:hypothetical protein
MNSKERLECALRGEPADRVGWAPEINDGVTKINLERVAQGRLKPLSGIKPEELNELVYARSNQIVGGDTFLRVTPYKTVRDGVEFGKRDEGAEVVEWAETPKGRLTARIRKEPESATDFRYEWFLKGPADYAVWRDVIERTRFIPDYDAVAETVRKLDGAGIVTLETPATPYMDYVMWFMGVEPMMYQIFDHERELTELFEVQHAKNLEACRIAAACPHGLVNRPIEDTSQHLSSPDMFNRYIRRHMTEYAEIAHSGGKLFIPHMCGHLADMLPILKDVPIDGIEAVTPPPTGNCPAKLARQVLGKGRVLVGGLDATRFALSTPAEFERALSVLLDDMKDDPRFVLGHEEIQVTARWENILIVNRLLAKTARA